MLNTLDIQNREVRIRAEVMVHEAHVKKTNPQMRTMSPSMDQNPIDSAKPNETVVEETKSSDPTILPEETSTPTKTKLTIGGKYISMYILLTAGAVIAAGLLFMR